MWPQITVGDWPDGDLVEAAPVDASGAAVFPDAPLSEIHAALGSGTLHPGDAVSRVVVFDVPVGGGDLTLFGPMRAYTPDPASPGDFVTIRHGVGPWRAAS